VKFTTPTHIPEELKEPNVSLLAIAGRQRSESSKYNLKIKY